MDDIYNLFNIEFKDSDAAFQIYIHMKSIESKEMYVVQTCMSLQERFTNNNFGDILLLLREPSDKLNWKVYIFLK